MYSPTIASLLRIFIDESDKFNDSALYEAIVLKARELNITGATVLRGIAGYGVHHTIHSSKILDMSHNLPLIIEIIDQKENLERLMPFLDEVIKEGLVTIEEIQIIKFGKKESN